MIIVVQLAISSICICDVLRSVGSIEGRGERVDFDVADVLDEEIMSFFVIGELDQKVQDVVSTCVSGFVVLSEAGVVVTDLHVGQSLVGITVISRSPFVAMNHVASEPFLEPHRAHDIVIGHRVKTVESALNLLLGAQARLERGRGSGHRVALPVHELILLESPRFKCQHINVFGLDELIFQIAFVKEEDLRYCDYTFLVSLNQSLSCCFSQTASVLSL